MPVAMTISEARQMQADDIAVDDDAVTQAEAEATEAEQAAATLERSAVAGGKGSAAPAAVIEQRAVAEFARSRALRVREAADRADAARRLLALASIGETVEQIHADAAQPDAGMVAALEQITDSYATLRQLADAHNGKVTDCIGLARVLAAEPAAPSGPRASSAHVTVHRGNRKIQSGSTVVQVVDAATVDAAVALALKGDPDAAVRRLAAAHTVAAPKRLDHYCVAANGTVHGWDDGNPKNHMPRLVARGEARELTPGEVEAHLDGRFDGHQAQA